MDLFFFGPSQSMWTLVPLVSVLLDGRIVKWYLDYWPQIQCWFMMAKLQGHHSTKCKGYEWLIDMYLTDGIWKEAEKKEPKLAKTKAVDEKS